MSGTTGAVIPITQTTNVTIPTNEVLTNIGGTLTGAGIGTLLDNAIGATPENLLYRGPDGWAKLALSSNLSITSGTLDTTAAQLTPGPNQYVFNNAAGTIEGVAACGGLDLIFNTGAKAAAGTYVIATALPYPVTWTDAKTWISGTAPSATITVQTIHNGTTAAVGGLSAMTVGSGTPNSPVSHATAVPNTSAAGDTVQVAIGTLSGNITSLGLHLDFIRRG